MASSSSTYSFWLVPPRGSPARDGAQRLIDALAARHGSPRFVPHLTLAGGFKSLSNPDPSAAPSSPSSATLPASTPPPSSSSSSDAALAARALAASHPAFSKPLRVKLQSVSSGSEYHRCVYALAEVSGELRAAAAGAAALGVEAALPSAPSPPFKPDETFMPHLSLLYSSDPRAREEGLAEASAAFAEAFREEGGGGGEGGRGANKGGGGGGEAPEAGAEGAAAAAAAAGCCCSWVSSEIEVWLTEGAVEDWRCEARVPFGKAEGESSEERKR